MRKNALIEGLEPRQLLAGTPPTVAGVTLGRVLDGRGTMTVTVTYAGKPALNSETLSAGDISVTGPNGYIAIGFFRSVDAAGDGVIRTVTYDVDAPGGTWNFADNGAYTVHVNEAEVQDTLKHNIRPADIATFKVRLAVPTNVKITDAPAASPGVAAIIADIQGVARYRPKAVEAVGIPSGARMAAYSVSRLKALELKANQYSNKNVDLSVRLAANQKFIARATKDYNAQKPDDDATRAAANTLLNKIEAVAAGKPIPQAAMRKAAAAPVNRVSKIREHRNQALEKIQALEQIIRDNSAMIKRYQKIIPVLTWVSTVEGPCTVALLKATYELRHWTESRDFYDRLIKRIDTLTKKGKVQNDLGPSVEDVVYPELSPAARALYNRSTQAERLEILKSVEKANNIDVQGPYFRIKTEKAWKQSSYSKIMSFDEKEQTTVLIREYQTGTTNVTGTVDGPPPTEG